MIALKAMSICLLLLMVLGLSVSLTTKGILGDVWQQLGVKQEDGNLDIYFSLTGTLLEYKVKNAKNISQKDRIAIINQLVAYAKKYVSSPEFKKRYDNDRKMSIPVKPRLQKINVDSIKAVAKKEVEEEIKGTEAAANSPNSKVRNAVPYRLEALKKEMKAVEDGTSPRIQQKIKSMEQINQIYADAYKRDLEKLERKFPENPQDLIKRRLQDLLNLTAEVDYNAETMVHPKTGWTVFVNPEYEHKSSDWKLAFRAGKETTDIVRAAAQKWLAEMK